MIRMDAHSSENNHPDQLSAAVFKGSPGIDGERETTVPPESDSSAQPPLRLGERLQNAGLIDAEQLKAALEFQKVNGGRLGDILISLGFIADSDFPAGEITDRPSRPLGEMLVNDGTITTGQLERALAFQQKSGGFLGDILITMGMVDADRVYRCLATQNQLGRVGTKFDALEARKLPYVIAKKHQVCVVNRQNTRYILAVMKMLAAEDITDIESFLDMKAEQVLADQHEIDAFWSVAYGGDLTHESVNKLEDEMPENSAKETFTFPQRVIVALLCLMAILGLVLNIKMTLFIVNIVIQSIYFAIATFKMYILIRGLKADTQIRISDPETESLDERELPVYTILVPIYKESEVIRDLLRHLDKLDYPKAKLDVRLLLEEDDTETLAAIQEYKFPYYCTVIKVPDSLPKTKPKACNYGLIRARGEYVVIYDAEDRPEPDQLKKAYLAFKQLPGNCVCIQAKLNYYNSQQNILTKWFTQEYSMWFDLLLPGVVRLNIPVPLGGTSNHFKTAYLKQVGAWDPFNVTEDADLGVRIFKEGYVTAVLDSRTWEEANSRLGNWLRQRSRWIKGYMQTWLVNMRHPVKLYREIGHTGFWGFHALILGSVLLPLINPILWFMMIGWYLTHALWIAQLFRGPIYYSALILLVIGNFFFVYSNAAGMYWVVDTMEKEGKEPPFSYYLVKYALLSPIYWLLMSVASYKALIQLVTKPFHWEKTRHGLHQGDVSKKPGR